MSEALNTDELGSALRAQLVISSDKPPPETKPPTEKQKTAPKKKKAEAETKKPTTKATPSAADKFTLLPESSIDYGYFSAHSTPTSPKGGFYITTAINYTNGPPHIGHAYEAVTSDVIARYHRSCGTPTYFVTGADEHGQKIANTAVDQGMVTKDLCDKYVNGFMNLNQRVLISNDDYVRTTSERHKRVARDLWRKCAEAGDIYLSTYEGWYLVRDETFVTDSEAALWEYKDPVSGQPLKKVSEASYFFKMSRFHSQLLEYIETNPGFIQPQSHRNLILSRLRSDPLRDLSISRTTFTWGIQVPSGFEQNHVMYVWVDALSNYLTGVNALGLEEGDDNLSKYWPADIHIIGKDILWFHTVIWPCLLMSAGIPLPKQVFAHGFVNDASGKKMSKSLGNVVDPHDMLDLYPLDTCRWYLCKEAPYGGELSFSQDSLRHMHNADLADTLGNLVHRVTNLCQKYCGGVVPKVAPQPPAIDFGNARKNYMEKMEKLELEHGSAIAIQAFRDVNAYLTHKEPWHLKGEEHAVERQRIVRCTMEAVYALAHLLTPFLPVGAKAIFRKLGAEPKGSVLEVDAGLVNLEVGTKVSVGDILYAKIASEEELKAEADAAAAKKQASQKQPKQKSTPPAANQPEFTKMDIRVGQITKIWNHPSADKLYCEEIDVGEDGVRTVASGLRNFYTLEELQDQLVLVVCNLKAAKMMGFESHGMILAAKSEDGTKVEIVTPPPNSEIGERIALSSCTDSYEPYSSTQVKKKKTWEHVSKDLKTGDGGVALWKEEVLMTSGGSCKVSSLVGAPIS